MTHSPHREQIISLGRAGCRHHRGAQDGLDSMTTFAEIRTQTLKVSRPLWSRQIAADGGSWPHGPSETHDW